MKKVLFSLAILVSIFVACEKDDNDPETPSKPNTLSGDISTDSTLDASVEYKLTGALRIIDGGILRIPAGTVIKAEKGFNKYILVEKGGKIYANGTAENPIKITSAQASPATGDWGGLVINGKAIISGPTGTEAEGSTEIDPSASYGGNVDNDNSGELTYVILEYTGAKSSADVEHNGLTLNAVGSGTKIENIFVIDGADDGIEFFGGSVNVTNLLVVNPDDDMFDATQGWRGTLTNAYGIWEAGYNSAESDPRGMEIDGNLDGNTPADINQTNFTMVNITIENKSDFAMHDAIKIRRGATANITNILVKGNSITDIIDLTDSKGNANAATVIRYKVEGTGTSVKNTDPSSDIAEESSSTGASTSVFAWTGYTF